MKKKLLLINPFSRYKQQVMTALHMQSASPPLSLGVDSYEKVFLKIFGNDLNNTVFLH